MSRRIITVFFTALFLLMLGACTQERTSGVGLVLPEGTVEDGKATFVELGCVYCHSVPNVELAEAEFPIEEEPLLVLGGKVHKVKTYGELVTSIVNPDHVIATMYRERLKSYEVEDEDIVSPMPIFNDEMTVSQLIDLVTFLDAHYEKMLPQYISHRHGFGNY